MTQQVELKPGQLWQWGFKVGENGWWPLEIVSSARRTGLGVGEHAFLEHGDVFTIVVTDDPGPQELNMQVGAHGEWVQSSAARWLVVLLRDKLVWMKHEELEVAVLIKDVP